MERSQQSDHEIYRVIVLQKNGTDILLASIANGFSLPEVRLPRWQRVAENLTAAMRDSWGEEVVCLFIPTIGSSPGMEMAVRYQVAEHRRSIAKSDTPTHWMPILALSRHSFADPNDYRAIQWALAEHDAYAGDRSLGPFGSLGWFRELIEWTKEVMAPKGLCLNGNIRQLNASPCFSLIRLETTDTAIWFKAVSEPSLREFPITLTLAELFPAYMPAILATRPAWNGWLSAEADGISLGETQELRFWEAAGTALAELQVKSISAPQRLLDLGAHDLRADTLSELVHPFLDVMGRLMDEQSEIPPPVVSRRELASVEESIQVALGLVRESGIADTLGHLDLNPGNIVVSRDRCVFLDWAEAFVGHPFFSLRYLLEHFRREVGVDRALEERLIASYAAEWRLLVSPADLTMACALSPLLAVFAYAAGSGAWRDEQRLQDSRTAGYLRGLTRRMNREARRLSDRRPQCQD